MRRLVPSAAAAATGSALSRKRPPLGQLATSIAAATTCGQSSLTAASAGSRFRSSLAGLAATATPVPGVEHQFQPAQLSDPHQQDESQPLSGSVGIGGVGSMAGSGGDAWQLDAARRACERALEAAAKLRETPSDHACTASTDAALRERSRGNTRASTTGGLVDMPAVKPRISNLGGPVSPPVEDGSLMQTDPTLADQYDSDSDTAAELAELGVHPRARFPSSVVGPESIPLPWRCSTGSDHCWTASLTERRADASCPHCKTDQLSLVSPVGPQQWRWAHTRGFGTACARTNGRACRCAGFLTCHGEAGAGGGVAHRLEWAERRTKRCNQRQEQEQRPAPILSA